MKKIVSILAIVFALSAAVFANSPGSEDVRINGWELKKNMGNPAGTAVLTDNELNGVDIDINPGKTMRAFMLTSSVDNWLYNVNEEMHLLFLGFDSHDVSTNIGEDPSDPEWNDKYIHFKIYGVDQDTGESLMVYHMSPSDDLWTGDGVYHLNTSTIFDTYIGNGSQPFGGERTLVVNKVEVQLLNVGGSYIRVGDAGDTLRVGFLDLPEPSTYAYGIMGLASIIGLRRRIRK